MIKAVILDFYGVIQTDEVIVWTEKNLAEHPDLRHKVDAISAQIDLDEITLDQYFEGLAAAVGRPVADVKVEIQREITINHPLLDVVGELHDKGLKTAILSNDGPSLRLYIEELGIAQYFDELFISGELNMMKPDARIYDYVVKELALQPKEVIFFDDRQVNIDGALRAGLQAEVYTSVSQVRKLLSDLL
jgi:putative hydrolase of the HAD superfamily